MTFSVKKYFQLLLIFLVLFSQLTIAADSKYEEGKVYRHVLSNGLTVLTMERHIAPLIYHQLTYKVGSRNEELGITGISHVVEHMMFKGTEKYGKGEASKTISGNSGIFNAFTATDMTSYYEYMPANKIEVAMEIESDRMQNCIFNPNEFKSEINVILQERRMRTESKAVGIEREVMNSMAFFSHPKRDPVIGWPSDLNHVTRDDAYKYYKTYYTPNNAFLVLVGDFDTDKILQTVKKYYEAIPKGPEVKDIWAVQEPSKVKKSFTIYHSDYNQPAIKYAFVIPNYKDADIPALRVGGMILCEKSRDARLYKKLVEQKSIALSVAGGFGMSKDESLFQISASLKPDSSMEKLEKMLWEEIELMKKEPVTDHELEKVKNRYRFGQATSYTKNADIGNSISNYEAYFEWEFKEEFYKRVLSVTKEDIIRAMKRFFVPEQSIVAYGYPKEGEKPSKKQAGNEDEESKDEDTFNMDSFNYQPTKEEIDIMNSAFNNIKSDEVAALKKIEPMITTLKLKNGIKLYTIESNLDSTVTIIGLVDCGWLPENLEKPGISQFMTSVMNRSTKEMNYSQLSERMAFVPFSFTVDGTYKSFLFQGNAMLKDADEMMKTGFSMVTTPQFPNDEIEKLRPRLVLSAKNRLKSTGIKAFYYMYNTIFEGHPLSQINSTEASIKGITREDMISLHKKYFQPQNISLLMLGNMKPEEMKKLADKYFGKWQNTSGAIKQMNISGSKPLTKKEIKVFPQKDYTECTINVGFSPVNNVEPDEDEIISVMNYILAGSALTSRMGVELRDKQGLIYGIKSELWNTNDNIGYWKFNTKTAPKNTEKVIKGIFSEIRKLMKDGITDEELTTAKNRRLGLLPFTIETPDDVAVKVYSLLKDKMPLNYFDKSAERIQKVTKEDVLRIAKKYFSLDNFIIVVDGPIEENSLDGLAEQL